MSTRTIVHLMRHGEVHNPEGVLYGRLPEYFLSDLGHKMAEAAADFLSKNEIIHLVASPLERAQQTAEPLSKILEVPITTDERVIEADNLFEGRTFGVGDGALQASRQLVEAAQPVPSLVGRALRRHRQAHARRHRRRP